MGKPNRIREWREKRGLTIEALAEMAGLSVSYLSRMERGGRNVSLKNIAKLAVPLRISEADLAPSRPPTVPLVGYVGAGAAMILYADSQGPFDEVPAPEDANELTVAVEIRGESLGSIFDRWLVYYDRVEEPPTGDLIGKLCVVGLEDGRILVKQLKKGQLYKKWTLGSNVEPPIYDVVVVWAARVKQMSPR